MALEAGDGRALPALSSAGWFFPLPSLESGADSVAQPVCHLALVAARAPPVVMREDAQSDTRLATIVGEPGAVRSVGKWPRFDVPEPLLRDGQSDSLVQ